MQLSSTLQAQVEMQEAVEKATAAAAAEAAASAGSEASGVAPAAQGGGGKNKKAKKKGAPPSVEMQALLRGCAGPSHHRMQHGRGLNGWVMWP